MKRCLLVWYKAVYKLLSELPKNTLRYDCYSPCGQRWNPVLARGSYVTGSSGSFGWLRQYKRQTQWWRTRKSVRTSARREHIDWQVLSFRFPKQATKTNKATFVHSSPIFRQKFTEAFGNPFLFNLWQAFGGLQQCNPSAVFGSLCQSFV